MSQQNSLFSLKMINFCKTSVCPSSQDLLAFQNGESSAEENAVICSHLSRCEFCAAEVELYSHVSQQADEPCIEPEIPAALFELAEAILTDKQKNFSLLNKLLIESESVKM